MANLRRNRAFGKARAQLLLEQKILHLAYIAKLRNWRIQMQMVERAGHVHWLRDKSSRGGNCDALYILCRHGPAQEVKLGRQRQSYTGPCISTLLLTGPLVRAKYGLLGSRIVWGALDQAPPRPTLTLLVINYKRRTPPISSNAQHSTDRILRILKSGSPFQAPNALTDISSFCHQQR